MRCSSRHGCRMTNASLVPRCIAKAATSTAVVSAAQAGEDLEPKSARLLYALSRGLALTR